MDQSKFKFTIFTPTYNREKVLHRVYESLLIQTFSDFEWLIIDDGSTDNTKQLVETWQNDLQTWFSIRYYWQPNQHKKVAHNYAVKLAQGEFFLTFDSDDRCVPQALERFNYHWLQIPLAIRDEFSAVTALCINENNELIGDYFPCDDWIDSNTLDIAYKFRVRGEKWGFHRTEVLRNFLFPDESTNISGLITEGVIWNKIAEHYKTRFVNEKLRIYFTDGAKNGVVQVTSSNQIRLNGLGGLYCYRTFLNNYFNYVKTDPITFIKVGAQLTRFYLHCDAHPKNVFWPDCLLQKCWVLMLIPLGFTLYLRDLLRERFGDS